MGKMPLVYVIVLSYNSKRTLQKCLNSILHSDYPNLEIILVDNSSTDGSFEYCKQQFQRINFIRNNKNIGFGSGNNVGIRYALEKFADYVFLLNSDAYIEPTTISTLIAQAQSCNNEALINPLILNSSGAIWFAGGIIDWTHMRALHNPQILGNALTKTEYATGCAMLIPQKIFERIGLFDQNYFLYYEDVDFSVRAQKAGFSCFVVPQAKVIHDEVSEQHISEKTYWLVFSGLIFFKSHMPMLLQPWRIIYLFGRVIKNLFKSIAGHSDITLSVRKAYHDYFYGSK